MKLLLYLAIIMLLVWYNGGEFLIYFLRVLSRCNHFSSLLKWKIEMPQLEKVRFIKANDLKLTQVGSFSFFHFWCVAANVSELFCWPFQQKINLFYAILPFILNVKSYIHINSPTWADENQFNCEKVCFVLEMSEINPKCILFNL